MRGDHLPDGDHLARHALGRHTERNSDGEVVGIFGPAFAPTAANPALSGLWIESCDGGGADRNVIFAQLRKLREIRRRDSVAIINVAKVKQAGVAADFVLAVQHDPLEPPEPDVPEHAIVSGIPIEAVTLHDRIALEVFALWAASDFMNRLDRSTTRLDATDIFL